MSMPAIFVTDFGPFPAVEKDHYTQSLEQLGRSLPHPKAILIMSGHWEAEGALSVTGAKKPGIMHDYSGFPEEFYRLDYPSPGNPILAEEIAELLSTNGFPTKVDLNRSLDHGAWVPLSRLFPKADIPAIQLTVPDEDNKLKIVQLGRTLSTLRQQGVLLIGAGAVSHNLRLALAHEKNDTPDDWAMKFDAWLFDKLNQGNIQDLVNYRSLAPSANLAAPTSEHFDPLFFILGAGLGEKLSHLHQSIRYGNGVMRVFAFGLNEKFSTDANIQNNKFDKVDLSSIESFPASDAPGWIL